MGMVATGTRQLALIRRRSFKLKQFGQGRGSSLVEGCPRAGLYGFQIGTAILTALRKHPVEE